MKERRFQQLAISTPDGDFGFDRLRSDPFGLLDAVSRGGRVTIRSDDPALVASSLLVLDGVASEVSLVPRGSASLGDIVSPDGSAVGVQAPPGVLVESAPPLWDGSTRWVLFTSGTTGIPKRIEHTLSSLIRTVRPRVAGPALVWGLLYEPNRMAGLQVLLHCLLSGQSLVAPERDLSLGDRIDALRDGGVNALSATPTLWRRILLLGAHHEWKMRQITLGGEIADQAVLSTLAHEFPGARITHVFASTESGAAFSVSDGRAGFPAEFLDDCPSGVRLEIRNGILHVLNPHSSAAEADGFVSTDDRVELVDDRVMFRGRATGVVNIGGSNIWPEEVESLLRLHPCVQDAGVKAAPNPITGNVLVATVVAADDAYRQALPGILRRWVRERATSAHVPARVRIVDELPTTAADKVER